MTRSGKYGRLHPIKKAITPIQSIFRVDSVRQRPVRKSAVITAAAATRDLASGFTTLDKSTDNVAAIIATANAANPSSAQ